MLELLQWLAEFLNQYGWMVGLLIILGLSQLANSYGNSRNSVATNQAVSNAMSLAVSSSQWGQEQSKELVVATRELVEAKQEIARLQGLEVRVKELEEEAKGYKDIKAQLGKLRSDLEDAIKTIGKRDRTIDDLTKERDSFKEKFETLQKRFDDLEKKYNELLSSGGIIREKIIQPDGSFGTYFNEPIAGNASDGAGRSSDTDSGSGGEGSISDATG